MSPTHGGTTDGRFAGRSVGSILKAMREGIWIRVPGLEGGWMDVCTYNIHDGAREQKKWDFNM